MSFFEDLFKKNGGRGPGTVASNPSGDYTLTAGGGIDVADTTEKASRRPEYAMLNPGGDPGTWDAEADYNDWFSKNKKGLGGNGMAMASGMQGVRR